MLLASEPYEIWQPLAVGHLDIPPHQQTSRGSYASCTRLMRTHPDGLWAGLRRLLKERGLAPADTVLVFLIQSGAETESGVLLTDGGLVYDFELRLSRFRDGTERIRIGRWLDATDTWQTAPLAAEIANAFIWRVPPRPTRLPAQPRRIAWLHG
ncbi:hypothetical protein [Streptomyces erythrochromogenes]|uniref:hypothetical protein n=1 Tax=Streptomyces erythrochromogenes TaxID=285574 RepID=UPI00382CBACE